MSAEPARQAEDLDLAPLGRERKRAPAVPAGSVVSITAQTARTARPARRRGSARDGLRDLIEPNWKLMAPMFAIAVVLTGFSTLTVPRPATIGMVLASIGIVALAPMAARFERKRLHATLQRNGLAALLVGLPMLLFGIAIARWTAVSSAQWQQSLGILGSGLN